MNELFFFALINLFSFGDFTTFFNDMNLVLKILVFMTVAQFVRSNVGTGPMGLALIAGAMIFVFLDLWIFFGGVYLLYLILMAGISGIIVDFFFVSGMHGGGQEATPEDNRAMEAAHIRQEAMAAAKHAARGTAFRMMRGRMGH